PTGNGMVGHGVGAAATIGPDDDTRDLRLGLGARALVAGHDVPLAEQAVHYLDSHHSETDKAKLRHSVRSAPLGNGLCTCRVGCARRNSRVFAHLLQMSAHRITRPFRIPLL